MLENKNSDRGIVIDFVKKVEELKRKKQQLELDKLISYPTIMAISEKIEKGEKLSEEEITKIPYIIAEIDRIINQLESSNKEIGHIEIPDIDKVLELSNLIFKLENGEKMSLDELDLIASATELEKKMARDNIIEKRLLERGKESRDTYHDNLALIGRIKSKGKDVVAEMLENMGLAPQFKK